MTDSPASVHHRIEHRGATRTVNTESPRPTSAGDCVLGCVDRTRDVWPRPPRPRAPGLLTCRPCADRILTTLDEVLELTVALDLVVAAGSAPRSGDGGRKRIKDEPVAPVPVSVPVTALTDVRSRRGTWVPDAGPAPADQLDDDVEPPSVPELAAAVDVAIAELDQAAAAHGPRSGEARTAATALDDARRQLAAARAPRRHRPRAIDPRDGDPSSVVGFLDRWTDYVRVGRDLLGAGPCFAERTDPATGLAEFCGRPTQYRRLARFEMGARTTGLFAVCTAGHVTRPAGQGDQDVRPRGAHGHRASRGTRHGRTVLAGVGLLRTHNDWVCSQDWVPTYWAGLRELRSDLGRAHGEPRPTPIGECPTGTGELDEHGVEVVCGQKLYASPYSDSIECQRCGRTWTHREWRFLGRQLGVLA